MPRHTPHPDESEDRKLFSSMIKEYEDREDKGQKGAGAKEMSYVAGGPVLGREKDFMKTPDTFRTDTQKRDYSSKAGEEAEAKPKSAIKQNKPRG
jgi:hypothetical protein